MFILPRVHQFSFFFFLILVYFSASFLIFVLVYIIFYIGFILVCYFVSNSTMPVPKHHQLNHDSYSSNLYSYSSNYTNSSNNGNSSNPNLRQEEYGNSDLTSSASHYLDQCVQDRLRLLSTTGAKFDEVIQHGFPVHLSASDIAVLSGATSNNKGYGATPPRPAPPSSSVSSDIKNGDGTRISGLGNSRPDLMQPIHAYPTPAPVSTPPLTPEYTTKSSNHSNNRPRNHSISSLTSFRQSHHNNQNGGHKESKSKLLPNGLPFQSPLKRSKKPHKLSINTGLSFSSLGSGSTSSSATGSHHITSPVSISSPSMIHSSTFGSFNTAFNSNYSASLQNHHNTNNNTLNSPNSPLSATTPSTNSPLYQYLDASPENHQNNRNEHSSTIIPREMTLKFTLTPLSMRADEDLLYGWIHRTNSLYSTITGEYGDYNNNHHNSYNSHNSHPNNIDIYYSENGDLNTPSTLNFQHNNRYSNNSSHNSNHNAPLGRRQSSANASMLPTTHTSSSATTAAGNLGQLKSSISFSAMSATSSSVSINTSNNTSHSPNSNTISHTISNTNGVSILHSPTMGVSVAPGVIAHTEKASQSPSYNIPVGGFGKDNHYSSKKVIIKRVFGKLAGGGGSGNNNGSNGNSSGNKNGNGLLDGKGRKSGKSTSTPAIITSNDI